MNIERSVIDDLNTIVKVKIEKQDYETKVNDVLKEYRKKMSIDGFRPGMVPVGLIKKKYGKQILAEEVIKMVNESLSKYIVDNNLDIIGQPLPSKTDQKPPVFDFESSFEFAFDIAFFPQYESPVSTLQDIPYYDIHIDDQLINSEIESYFALYGKYIPAEGDKINQMIIADFTELDGQGNPLEKGFSVKKSSFLVSRISDEEIKNKMEKVRVDEEIVFNPAKAFQNNRYLSYVFSVQEEKNLPDPDHDFCCKVTSAQVFKNAELNQELYDIMFGKDSVHTEEEFREKVKERLKEKFRAESDKRFFEHLKKTMMEKADIRLPEEFLKRWLDETNENNLTEEQIEKEYPLLLEGLKWKIIVKAIAKENNIEVSEKEITESAYRIVIRQFYYQYGIVNPDPKQIEEVVISFLKNENQRISLTESLYESKALGHLRNTLQLNHIQVTQEEFGQLDGQNNEKK